MNKETFCFIALIVIICSCRKDQESFKIYTSYWGETLWKIKVFKQDSLFIIPEGHFSNEISKKIDTERYGDTLSLSGEIISSLPNLQRLIFMDQDSCFIDINNNIYCLNDLWQEKQSKETEYVNSLEQRFLELDLVENIYSSANRLDQRILLFPLTVVYEEEVKKYVYTIAQDSDHRYIIMGKIKFDPSKNKFYKLDTESDNWIKIN